MKLKQGLFFKDNYNQDIYYVINIKGDLVEILHWQTRPSKIEKGFNAIKTWQTFLDNTTRKSKGRIQLIEGDNLTKTRRRKILSQVFTL